MHVEASCKICQRVTVCVTKMWPYYRAQISEPAHVWRYHSVWGGKHPELALQLKRQLWRGLELCHLAKALTLQRTVQEMPIFDRARQIWSLTAPCLVPRCWAASS